MRVARVRDMCEPDGLATPIKTYAFYARIDVSKEGYRPFTTALVRAVAGQGLAVSTQPIVEGLPYPRLASLNEYRLFRWGLAARVCSLVWRWVGRSHGLGARCVDVSCVLPTVDALRLWEECQRVCVRDAQVPRLRGLRLAESVCWRLGFVVVSVATPDDVSDLR